MDKQERLEDVIGTALNQWSAQFHPTISKVDAIAAAVRSFMGSGEVVERAAKDVIRADHVAVESEVEPTTQEWGIRLARAALSAAIGEDIGGGRG